MRKIVCHILPVALVILSCSNPFSGRDSENPVEGEGTYLTPIEPQRVLINLENAYNEKIITNFEKCLDQLFFFYCDHLIYSNEEDSGWAYTVERSLTEKIFTQYRRNSGSMSLSLTMKELPDLDKVVDTVAWLHREYRLVAETGLDSGSADSVSYEGTAIFELIQTGFNLWTIRSWTDLRESAADESWADFKNGFR